MRIGSANPDPRNNGSRKGPLRAIVETIRARGDLFDRAVVRLECGHSADATPGAVRARCRECREDVERCEHGIPEAEYCEACNAEYKRARRANGLDDEI